MRKAPWYTHPLFPILVVLLVNLVLGAIFVTDYGESWDEDRRIRAADKSIDAYQGIQRKLEDEKGPFFIIVARLGSRILVQLYKNWQPIEAWHFMTFLSFLIAIFSFYILCLRVVRPGAALAATLLFNTQPLLWGHAFMNPKDIPFMAFFLASVASGLVMAERFDFKSLNIPNQPNSDKKNKRGIGERRRADWRAAMPRKRVVLTGLVVLLLVVLSIILFGGAFIHHEIEASIRFAYTADPATWAGQLFNLVAKNARTIPVESYISKAFELYARLLIVAVFLLLAASVLIFVRLFPSTTRQIWDDRFWPLIYQVFRALTNGWLILAALLLGFSSAIRVLGPFSGALVGGYVLWKIGRKALIPLIVYAAIGFLVTYICWPYLWSAPVTNYLSSVSTAADYPSESGVLFAGSIYDQAPPSYFPILLAIQISGSAILAILLGLGVSLFRFISRSVDRALIILLLVWFILPPLAAILLQSTMYDNFRQFLFILPPLFVIAALGFQFIFDKIRPIWINVPIVAVLILPNLAAIVNLHPYEYVYYNELVGGDRGAFRRFEMDYWATSYKEAVNYLNQNAPPDSTVVVWGPSQLVRKYIRPDIEVDTYVAGQTQENLRGDYIVVLSKRNSDLQLFPKQPDLLTVERDGAIFSVVRQLPPENRLETPP